MKLSKTLGIATTAALVAAVAGAMNSISTTGDTVGKVTGKVVFEGERPKAKALTISGEQSKGCCPEGVQMDTMDHGLLIGEKGGIANAVITIEIKGKQAEVPAKAFDLDQSKCRFEPHVIVVPVGAKVNYLNSDDVSHNIHTYAVKNDGLNKTVSGHTNVEQKFEKAETVKVTCDIHPWMASYIVVTDASAWATTGADGSFAIEGLAPGDYKFNVWHETLGKGKGTATIKEDGTSEAVEIKMGVKKKKGGKRRR
jgi:plastocyanin